MQDDRYVIVDDVMERIVNEQEAKLAEEQAVLEDADLTETENRSARQLHSVPTTAGALSALSALRRTTGVAALPMGMRSRSFLSLFPIDAA